MEVAEMPRSAYGLACGLDCGLACGLAQCVYVCTCLRLGPLPYLGRQQLPVRVAPYNNVGSVNNFGIKPPTRMSKNITVPGTARVQMRQQRVGVDC